MSCRRHYEVALIGEDLKRPENVAALRSEEHDLGETVAWMIARAQKLNELIGLRFGVEVVECADMPIQWVPDLEAVLA